MQVDVAKQAYYQAEGMEEEEELDDEDDESANPRDVGHNIYILAHQVNLIYTLFSSHQFSHNLDHQEFCITCLGFYEVTYQLSELKTLCRFYFVAGSA